MFTGIIRNDAILKKHEYIENILTIEIETYYNINISIGDSISINGICLTVISTDHSLELNKSTLRFHAMNETLEITTISQWNVDSKVNLELACLASDRLDGHIVYGHVHTKATVIDIINNLDGSKELTFYLENTKKYNYERLLLHKGSIAIDGVSLTVIEPNSKYFKVCIIPHTYSNTIFYKYKIGTICNIEFNNIELTKFKLAIGANIFRLLPGEIMDLLVDYAQDIPDCPYPNPYVACAIVYDNIIVGLGNHSGPGSLHAEANAIAIMDNSIDLEKCTIYITLEPCVDFNGKKTKPCIDLVKNAKKIYIGMVDPDIRVSGKSLSQINNYEIVTTDKILELYKHYIYHRKTGKPYITCKIALSINGIFYTETKKYITSLSARNDVHYTRSKVQSILTTSKTIDIDKPILNCRYLNNKPIDKHIIILSNDNIKYNYPIYQCMSGNIIDVFINLGKQNIVNILTECGPFTLDTIIDSGLWNELHIYIDGEYIEPGKQYKFNRNLLGLKPISSEHFETTTKYIYINNKLNN